jgi:uncharacterized protein YkwD
MALAAALLLLLSACGGGGGDGGTPAATSNSGSANVVTGVAAPSCGLANFDSELLQRVNARRASGGSCGSRGTFATSGALQWNLALTQAAAGHSQDMATLDYFSHTSADGRTPDQRISAAGYAWHAYGENIAAGYPTVQAVVDAWLASDGHCANIMNPGLRDIGVACVPGTGTSTYSNYWTMDLGAL